MRAIESYMFSRKRYLLFEGEKHQFAADGTTTV